MQCGTCLRTLRPARVRRVHFLAAKRRLPRRPVYTVYAFWLPRGIQCRRVYAVYAFRRPRVLFRAGACTPCTLFGCQEMSARRACTPCTLFGGQVVSPAQAGIPCTIFRQTSDVVMSNFATPGRVIWPAHRVLVHFFPHICHRVSLRVIQCHPETQSLSTTPFIVNFPLAHHSLTDPLYTYDVLPPCEEGLVSLSRPFWE